jgi:hypothetical protein
MLDQIRLNGTVNICLTRAQAIAFCVEVILPYSDISDIVLLPDHDEPKKTTNF